ncbi:MAG: DUF2283 domain-containing protein [Deferrisomatales bacterium]|nr:DUF2283 domain-containing protein [Deferrisomatales bacterium]
MAEVAVTEYLKLVPAVRGAPGRYLWSSYDAEADVLYVNFKKPSHATDSELTDDDVIVRYPSTLHAGSSQRSSRSPRRNERFSTPSSLEVYSRSSCPRNPPRKPLSGGTRVQAKGLLGKAVSGMSTAEAVDAA